MKKLILSGGAGYLGGLIQDHFQKDYEIYILTRSHKKSTQAGIHFMQWNGESVGEWTQVLENADLVINLAGKNINTRFTEENKKGILQSRIQTTEAIGQAIEACTNPPKMWLNASSVAVYKESKEYAKDEFSPTNGEDFLSEVSQKWEKAFYKYPNVDTKKAVFRITLILGDHKGSAYQTLKKLVKVGGGGKAGDGEQIVSWLGEIDFVNALEFIIDNELEGPFNFGNPNPISNAELMKQLREKYNVPFGMPAPAFMIKIGANIIGTAPELILRSQNTQPKRLLEHGFKFTQTRICDI
ncbi:TIGR01777 family protein [Flavobacteriaceae bacterium Ap0902]|nr:TIGR01777 family protein [Flavobacteriaceae bacterium Ap0902]